MIAIVARAKAGRCLRYGRATYLLRSCATSGTWSCLRFRQPSSQKALVERQGEQFAQRMATGFAIQVRQNHLEVAAELPQNLTTGATGRRRASVSATTAIRSKLAMAFPKAPEHRHALGADRQARRSAYSMLHPVMTTPSLVSSAAPTLKCEKSASPRMSRAPSCRGDEKSETAQ